MTDEAIPPNFEFVTRPEARKQGKKRYFTGKPCRNGHTHERFVSSKGCCTCAETLTKKTRKDHPERNRRYVRKWERNHPEHVKKIRSAGNKRRYWSDVESSREKGRLKARAVKHKKNERLAGRPKSEICEACGDKDKKIVFDHCHSTGKFRGWICEGCNVALGMAKDCPDKLISLAIYLERFNGSINNEI